MRAAMRPGRPKVSHNKVSHNSECLSMRLFAGLDLPETVLRSLDARIAPLRPLAPLSWAPLENLHITTKFIGEWPEEKLDLLKQELAQVATPGPIPIQLEGLGWFPNPHSPRVFWAAIGCPESLELLAKETDLVTAKLGVEPETRQFHPHLTLARIKASNSPLAALRHAVAKMESVDFGSFVAQSFFLYLSEPSAKGSSNKYTKLAEFPLST